MRILILDPLAMGLAVAVAVVAKAMMMNLCQCTRVKLSTTQVVAVVAAVAAVDGELCFADSPSMKAFRSTFFTSTSNVQTQLIVVN